MTRAQILVLAPRSYPRLIQASDTLDFFLIAADKPGASSVLVTDLNELYDLMYARPTFLESITTYTGGGPTALDSLNLTAVSIDGGGNLNQLYIFRVAATGHTETYQARAGTDATSAPDIIRPANYAASTNEIVFYRATPSLPNFIQAFTELADLNGELVLPAAGKKAVVLKDGRLHLDGDGQSLAITSKAGALLTDLSSPAAASKFIELGSITIKDYAPGTSRLLINGHVDIQLTGALDITKLSLQFRPDAVAANDGMQFGALAPADSDFVSWKIHSVCDLQLDFPNVLIEAGSLTNAFISEIDLTTGCSYEGLVTGAGEAFLGSSAVDITLYFGIYIVTSNPALAGSCLSEWQIDYKVF